MKKFYKQLGIAHLCSMDVILTHAQAWQDFYNFMQSKKILGEIARIPADVQEANYAYLGRRRANLGASRIQRLLTKYAPERYEFTTVVRVK